MPRFFIKTTDSTSIIDGDTMLVDGGYLYVYKCNGCDSELYGMFKADAVIDAHRTETK